MRDDVNENPRDPAWTSREPEAGHGALDGADRPPASVTRPRALGVAYAERFEAETDALYGART